MFSPLDILRLPPFLLKKSRHSANFLTAKGMTPGLIRA
jgi:hypothetical protein